MKRTLCLAVSLTVVLACSSAFADGDPYHLVPSPPDLYDLDHSYYYTWGIDTPWDTSTDLADAAVLSFTGIYNWQKNEPNILYVHLLDDAPLGVTPHYDGQGWGDAFLFQGPLLTFYVNLSHKPHDIEYAFSPDEIEKLNEFAADGRFALGFDPDCHFYNSGVALDIAPAPIPEPTTMALLGAAAVPLLLRRRRRA